MAEIRKGNKEDDAVAASLVVAVALASAKRSFASATRGARALYVRARVCCVLIVGGSA